MIPREANKKLIQLSTTFKVIAIIDPRQAGKTTLAKTTLPDKPYFSLENPDTRNYVIEDPQGFCLKKLEKTQGIFSQKKCIKKS
jgi:uncharacterized protein